MVELELKLYGVLMRYRIEQYKKLFDLIMRLVVVYSVEKIRIRNKFDDDVFDWYQQMDHAILNSADRQVWWWYGQKFDHPLANSDLRDRVVYELRRYFWNYYQFGFEPNNLGLFNHLRIEKQEVVA